MVDTFKVFKPGEFEPERHYYPRALNASIHPLARSFFNLRREQIAERHQHLHPEVKENSIAEILHYQPSYFFWGGSDLMLTSNEQGERKLVLIETNSCASGQKSMPQATSDTEGEGYTRIISSTLMQKLKRRSKSQGSLAVIYDKNLLESSGYAAAIADCMQEEVFLVPCHADVPPEKSRVRICPDNWIEIKNDDGEWLRLRGAFRYVTQKPWDRIPPISKTVVVNPVIACLAGGRNKLLAAKAYDFLNAEFGDLGLQIQTPETVADVAKQEIPIWVERMGGLAVVKVPYANAGTGVYTITSPEQLNEFMETDHVYDRFIVQSLIGNFQWSSRSKSGRLFHVGTVPNKKLQIFVNDIRMVVCSSPSGFIPVAIYARRARSPLPKEAPTSDSWAVLGTNLSQLASDNSWSTDTDRLLMVDGKDFNRLGVGIDDLIKAYMQTVMSIIAIDKMAKSLVNKKGAFRYKMFKSLNPDEALNSELIRTN